MRVRSPPQLPIFLLKSSIKASSSASLSSLRACQGYHLSTTATYTRNFSSLTQRRLWISLQTIALMRKLSTRVTFQPQSKAILLWLKDAWLRVYRQRTREWLYKVISRSPRQSPLTTTSRMITRQTVLTSDQALTWWILSSSSRSLSLISAKQAITMLVKTNSRALRSWTEVIVAWCSKWEVTASQRRSQTSSLIQMLECLICQTWPWATKSRSLTSPHLSSTWKSHPFSNER